MAFDTSTRNRLAKFVGEARRLLTDEFIEQLQSLYGISATGSITPIERLGHLDAEGRELAGTLRQRIAYLVSSHADARDATEAAVARLTREQAFTIVNRLAAIRMAETRGLIVESVGQQYQSKGFKVFESVAGSAIGETFDRYRCYLFCLFDELAIDLGVLFDRKSPQAMLFPREPALLALLDLLDAPDLQPLWAEDETIGWIYQYYNDEAERKKMREESAAPRNSRELAVRNQFFTPRYVVEFLTDNTLGRIWYEMTQGKTSLKDSCRYLVRRPNEIFLEAGESAPEDAVSIEAEPGGNLSQEDLLKQPVHIVYRPLKDPREIRLLDPACGSMHFGLYAFDLFTVIYDEAWEIAHSTDLPAKSVEPFAPFVAYADAFADKAAFLRDVPRLIIERNLHGIDIDPRAAQIAGLSLWLRAQRAWHQANVKPTARPRITRSNLVCAEPMPGVKELLREFVEQQFPAGEQAAFRFLLTKIFDRMTLAGEAGSLLSIEEEIRSSIAEAKKIWEQEPHHEQKTLFADVAEKSEGVQKRLDLTGITTEEFWERAEERIYDSLAAYAERAEEGGGLKRRLFADDAAQGFAFIDLCRKQYDAVVMNPPFGSPTDSVMATLPADAASNVYPAFVLRGAELCDGFVGAITDRTFVVQQSFGRFRTRLISDLGLIALVELGWGVLDGADVQVAAYCVRKGHENAHLFASISDVASTPASCLLNIIADSKWTSLSREVIHKLPSSAFAHTLPATYLTHLESKPSLRDLAVLPRGLGSNNAGRTYKAWYEVPGGSIGEGKTYRSLCNGGAFSPFYRDDAGVAEWLRRDGKLLVEEGYSETSKAYDQKCNPLYFEAGLSFPKQASSFNVAALPEDAIPTREGKGIVPNNSADRLPLLAYLNSAYARYFVEATNGLHKQSGAVGMTPVPRFTPASRAALSSLAIDGWKAIAQTYLFDEASRLFSRPATTVDVERLGKCDLTTVFREIDRVVFDEAGVGAGDQVTIAAERRAPPAPFQPAESDTVSYVLGCVFGRWDIRCATGERPAPELPDPFASLPACPPGMLQSDDGLPLSPEAGRRLRDDGDYPLDIAWDGILVDDPEHPLDIERRVRATLSVIWGDSADAMEHKACTLLGMPTLRDWFRRPAGFFADHLKRYSKSRRQAPIYWPLSTKSGEYTLWIYYHRLNDQTLHKCLADFLDPKITKVEKEIATLAGKSANKAAELRGFVNELRDLRDEIDRIVKLPWRPNLNDGVLITASPLWKLFRLSKWSKDLKACWDELENGDYDWAHLAHTIWPARVEKVCESDRSIAIAHGLEHLCKVEPPKPKKPRGKKAPS